ncbi:hypothetical protein KQI65_07590 [bacterium]|nr:hypothetical protein [bacterium]
MVHVHVAIIDLSHKATIAINTIYGNPFVKYGSLLIHVQPKLFVRKAEPFWHGIGSYLYQRDNLKGSVMSFLEIIEIRSHNAGHERLRQTLIQFAQEINAMMGDVSVRVFARKQVPSDFSVHIEHPHGSNVNGSSHVGSQLLSELRGKGLINRTLWIQEI